MVDILISILVGAIAGWLASIIMKSSSGLIMNIILGILGGFVAKLILFGFIGVPFFGIFGNIIASAAGACLLIFIVRLIRNRKK